MLVVDVSDIPQTIYKNTVTTECEIVLDSGVVSFQDQSCDEMDAQTMNKRYHRNMCLFLTISKLFLILVEIILLRWN